MNKPRCWQRLIAKLLLILLIASAAACIGQPEVKSRVWIDLPLDGSILSVGESSEIISHLYAKDGVKEYSISIDGKEIEKGIPFNSEESFIEVYQEWIPERAGQRTIAVSIYDENGISSSRAEVNITVIEALEEIAAEEPPEEEPPAEEPPAEKIPDEEPPAEEPPAEEPPVDEPPDTTPPSITNMQASTDPIVEEPCQPNNVTISAAVSDVSGLLQVKLYYRIVKGTQYGTWQTPAMSAVGGGQYQLIVGPSQFKSSMNPYGGSIFQYYIKAWDNSGNIAESTNGNVNIQVCVQ